MVFVNDKLEGGGSQGVLAYDEGLQDAQRILANGIQMGSRPASGMALALMLVVLMTVLLLSQADRLGRMLVASKRAISLVMMSMVVSVSVLSNWMTPRLTVVLSVMVLLLVQW